MRFLAALLALLFIAAEAEAATCTGCSLSGVSLAVDTTPDTILIVGDPQPGSICSRWGVVPEDAGDQACGAAQVARMVWVIEDAFSRYPIDAIVVEGDLVDSTQTWEINALAAGISSLSDAIKSKLYLVNGNHDANDTNCTTMWRSHSTAFDGTGSVMPLGDLIPLQWSVKLRRTRLIGIQSALITMRTSTACHAQNRAGKFPGSTTGYSGPVCFGDTSAAVGASANGVACTVGANCQSGQCGTWEDYYEPAMTFLRDEVYDFMKPGREEAFVLNMHQALCRPTAASSCDFALSGGSFSVTHNLKQCGAGSTTPGAYCDNENSAHFCINTVSGLPSAADCVDGVDDRPGFETRDRFLGIVQQIPSRASMSKSLVQATGHVGSAVAANQAESYYPGQTFSNASFSHNKDILGTGLPYLVAEIPGPYTSSQTALTPHAAVVEIRHNQPPSVIEYLKAPNTAPTLDEIGTAGEITLASGTDSYNFTGTDPDYQDLDYYIDTSATPALAACLALDQKTTTQGGTLDADLDATACSAGRYPASGEYTICITDGLLTGGVPTGNGLSSCEQFHVVVPELMGSTGCTFPAEFPCEFGG